MRSWLDRLGLSRVHQVRGTLLMFSATLAGAAIGNFATLVHYRPGGDDFSVVAASSRFQPSQWFLHGFSDYFTVYPGSTEPYTNFVRPGVNFVVFIDHWIFGTNWGLYFLFACLVAAVGAALVYSMVPASRINFALVLASFVLSPTITSAYEGIPFMFDVAVAVLTLAALRLVAGSRNILALIAVLLAVFTKETGVVTSLAFAAYFMFVAKRRSWSALFMTPIALWVLVRFLGVGLGGTYTMKSLDATRIAANVLTALFVVPAGSATGAIGSIRDQFLNEGITATGVVQTASVIVSVGILAVLLSNMVHFLRVLRNGPGVQALALVLLVFLVAYASVMGLTPRFLPVTMSLTLLLILRERQELAFARLLVGLWVMSLLFAGLSPVFVHKDPHHSAATYDVLSNAYLKAAGGRVLIINAPNIYSAPKYVQAFYGYRGESDFLFNTVEYSCPLLRDESGARPNERSTEVPQITRNGDSVELTFQNIAGRDCYGVVFSGTSPSLSGPVSASQGNSFTVEANTFFLSGGNGDVFRSDGSVPFTRVEKIVIPQKYDQYLWIDYVDGSVLDLAVRAAR